MTSESFYDPSFRSLTPKDSKSVANALRALHDRIKALELENTELKDRLIVLDSRAENDREKWQIRMMEEVQIAKDKQDLLQSQLLKKDEEIEKLKKILKAGQSSESQFYLTEIQTLTEKIAELKQKISLCNNQTLQQLVEENMALKEKVRTENKFSKTLQQENQIVKLSLRNLENIKNLGQNSENSEEFLQKFKNFESKFQYLSQVNVNQNRLIEDLKKEVSRLSKLEVSRQSTQKTSKSKPKEKFSSKNDSKSCTKSSRSNSQTYQIKQHTRNSSKVTQESLQAELDVKKMIQESEKKLELLNSKYKNLVGLSKKDSASLQDVRKNLDLVAEEIDHQSDELFELKKKHQEFLRVKLNT